MGDSSKRLSEFEILNVLSLSKNATAVYTTENLIIETANDAMIAFWGKDRSIIGMPLPEAVAGLENQPFIGILQQVWRTGITYEAKDTFAQLLVDDKLKEFYFDFVYHAVKKEDGSMYCILHTAKDVTEQVASRRKSEQSEDKYRTLFSSVDDGFCIIEKEVSEPGGLIDFRYVEANPAFEKQTGVKNIIGKTIRQAFPGEEAGFAIYDNILATGKAVRGERTIAFTKRVMEYYACRMDGEARQVAVLFKDITQRKKNEADLQESEARFRSVFEQAPVAIGLLEGRQMIIAAGNEKIFELWGKSPSIKGMLLIEALPELEGQPFVGLLDHVYSSGEPYFGYGILAKIKRDGKLDDIYFDFSYTPVTNANGIISGIIVLAIDVTEKVLSRRKIEQAEEKLRLALLSAGMGTWSADLETDLLTLSDKSREIHGIELHESITLQESFTMIQPQFRHAVESAILNTIAENQSFSEEYLINPKNGDPAKWLRSTAVVNYDADGKPISMSGSILDITEQKQDEQRKNDFIGMVSHEMKTPLTSLSGYLQLLQMKAGSEDVFAANMLGKANKQINKMTNLINGFLNVSRLESGRIQIDKQRFDMAVLVREAEEEALSLYNTHRIIFYPVEETFVNADKDKIGQVISNLISNAIKYSPANTLIKVACVQQENRAMVSVKDEGIGIKDEDKPKLFDRYYRVNDGGHAIASGFGIGLYLCAEIIQRHDGKIWIESEVGTGSVFYFTLPVIL